MTARIHSQPRHRQDTTRNSGRSHSSGRKNGAIDTSKAASTSTLSAAAVVAAVARLHQAHLRQQALFDPESSNSPSTSPCGSPSLSPRLTDGRRTNKPLMEKRRRARINQSLAALKALILDSARLENTKHSKLEKADILELTVRHLQRQRSLAQPGLSRYKAGYQDCSREVARYLDAPDIITGNTSPIDPAFKQRMVRHLDSCVSELDLDLGSRPDSGLGSSPGSVTDRVLNPGSPMPLDHPHHSVAAAAALHCSAALGAAAAAGLVKDVTDLDISARPDSSTAPGDENNNSSRPTSAFTQMHAAAAVAAGMTGIDPITGAAANPMSVVQVIPSRLPDGQVVFLLPSHYVQLAAAAAANGISIGPTPPQAIWATTNMALLKETDKLMLKRPLCGDPQDWVDLPVKPSKSPRIECGAVEQPLDFTTSSAKKLKAAAARYLAEQQYKQQMHQETLAAVAAAAALGCERPLSCPSSSQSSEAAGINYVKREEIKQEVTAESESATMMAQSQHSEGAPSPPSELQQQIKDEEGMWRPW